MSTSRPKIILVEDEDSLGEGLSFNFDREGYDVVWYTSGSEAQSAILADLGTIDAVVLDLMLPEVDGFEILKSIRQQADCVPILVLSARSLEMDKVRALALGADDYVTKPFSLPELMLRIRGLIKRSRQGFESKNIFDSKPIPFGLGVFYPDTQSFVTGTGESVKLSPTEVSLLNVLASRENMVLTRSQLLQDVWQYHAGTETRTVDVFIGKLRRLAERNESAPDYIISIRGIGYAYVTSPEMRATLRNKKGR
jgi:DNA-binding response OmpR family regulator